MTISDTSVVLHLSIVGRIQLLETLFGTIHIPQAVARELESDRRSQGITTAYTFLRVSDTIIQSEGLEIANKYLLDEGESEAIALALLNPEAALLIDEAKGRAVASALGLQIAGLLGVLQVAKEQGTIPSVKGILDDALANGFRVNPKLYSSFLNTLGEAV